MDHWEYRPRTKSLVFVSEPSGDTIMEVRNSSLRQLIAVLVQAGLVGDPLGRIAELRQELELQETAEGTTFPTTRYALDQLESAIKAGWRGWD